MERAVSYQPRDSPTSVAVRQVCPASVHASLHVRLFRTHTAQRTRFRNVGPIFPHNRTGLYRADRAKATQSVRNGSLQKLSPKRFVEETDMATLVGAGSHGRSSADVLRPGLVTAKLKHRCSGHDDLVLGSVGQDNDPSPV